MRKGDDLEDLQTIQYYDRIKRQVQSFEIPSQIYVFIRTEHLP